MKKLILLSILFSSGTWANTQYKATSECEFDYDGFKFCSKSNIVKYKKALTSQKPNFDSNYILLNIGTPKNIRYVAIDSKNGLVYPLSDEIIGFKDDNGGLTGKPPVINYSIDNANLCIKGSVMAYRNSYDNVKVCYSVQNNEHSKYKKEFIRADFPENIED
ncbi:hypothetical protein [Acinetobacter sp. ANC 4648]|uniref:hypothetical protein n=1 Tax=Acinetobacter sp. ANC 4648 TaxID=1977875 RepID=UPI000B5579F0|nr:hypothetical protein [Acinetobacter sp. ANC 4648]OTG82313.1 hypothetical protein B9T27_08745 [Acinetobacter sp. ANC 4648]